MSILSSSIETRTEYKKNCKSKYTTQPWITPGLTRCIRHRDKLHSKVRRFPKDEVLRLIFHRYRNFCNELLKKLKKHYESDQLVSNSNNSKGLWRAIKKITCNLQNKNNQPLDLIASGKNPVDSLNKCNTTTYARNGQL